MVVAPRTRPSTWWRGMRTSNRAASFAGVRAQWFFPLRRPSASQARLAVLREQRGVVSATRLSGAPVQAARGQFAWCLVGARGGVCARHSGRQTAAQVSHPAPRRGRRFVLRALAQGRDRLARERGWRATILGSALHQSLRRRPRVDTRQQVGLSPAACRACWSSVAGTDSAFIGEAATLLGLPWIRHVRV